MKRLHHSWVMVIFAVVILVNHAMINYSFGVFLKPITEAFKWDRGTVSGALSVYMIVFGLLSVIAGRLCDKYGPRLLLTASAIFSGAGFLLMSTITQLWQVYLYTGIILGIGSGLCLAPIVSTIARWFDRKRGLALGLTWSGIAIGGTITPLLVQGLIGQRNWQWAYLWLGISFFIIMLPISQFMKRSPDAIGLKPYGYAENLKDEVPLTEQGYSFGKAIRTARFWFFSLILFCLSFFTQTLGSHLVPHARDIGINPAIAASFVSIYVAVSAAGRNLCGVIVDRIGGARTLLIGFAMITLTIVWLLLAHEVWMFYAFALFYGIAFGSVVPLQTLMPGELFGLKSLGIISAMMMLIGQVGGAIGVPLAGTIFDKTGSYQLDFYILIGIGVMAVTLSLLLLRDRTRSARL